MKLRHNHQQLIDITFSSVQEEELHFFTDKFLTVSMIGYARYGFAKYDPNILKQIKHYTAHLSSQGYPTAIVSCSGHCQMAGQSFRLHRLTVTAVFVNSLTSLAVGIATLICVYVRGHSYMSRDTAFHARLYVHPTKLQIILCMRVV